MGLTKSPEKQNGKKPPRRYGSCELHARATARACCARVIMNEKKASTSLCVCPAKWGTMPIGSSVARSNITSTPGGARAGRRTPELELVESESPSESDSDQTRGGGLLSLLSLSLLMPEGGTSALRMG